MKRRRLIGLGAAALIAGWALRPSDRGQAHAPYFDALNQLLRREGNGIPLLVVDMDALDHNTELLARRLAGKLPVRLVAKSLAANGLLGYLAEKLGTQRFMVFHQPQLNELARAFPRADLLLGKPLPAKAALSFYQQLGTRSAFDPSRQLTWLVDTPQRLAEYAQLAGALDQPLQIALEIDVGLARGGFPDPAQLATALTWLREHKPSLVLRGLMGYEVQVAHTPPWQSQASAFAESMARYRAFIDTARGFTDLWPNEPLLNGAGSLTYPLHAREDTPLNEVAVGSVLLKPGDFDSRLLGAHRPALYIASPVLKAQDGALPYLGGVQPLLQRWDRNRERALYIYGGQWPAEPLSPAGLRYDSLYGRSANQERLIGSERTAVGVDDWVFLRPERSEGVLTAFNELRLLRHGRFVGSWAPHKHP
ncbi:MAG TPA: alanine racemase [Pseudomonas sp.]|nr:alanine racemase [Pseudomonas sp.]